MTATAPEAEVVSTARRAVVVAIALVTVASVVSWRSDAIFTGTVDTVVIAKAVLAFAALGASVLLLMMTPQRRPVALRPLLFVVLVTGVSLLGALVSGTLMPTAVVIVRVGVLALIVLVLLASTPWRTVVGALLGAMGVVATVAAVTGAGTLLATGRLSGGIPQVQENELAGLAAFPLLGIVVLLFRDGLRWILLVPSAVLMGILLATQSRTTLLGVGIAAVLALVIAPRLHWTAAIAVFASVPVGYALVAFTSFVTELVVRDQTIEELTSLSARTDAWSVVLGWSDASWERWIGLGLAVKQIEVDLPFRDVQVFDSSWVSVLAQAGAIGMGLFVLWVLWTTVHVVRYRDGRHVLLPLLALLAIRGLTENGLLDANPGFLVLFAIAVAADPASRRVIAAPEPVIPFHRTAYRATPHPIPRQPEGALT